MAPIKKDIDNLATILHFFYRQCHQPCHKLPEELRGSHSGEQLNLTCILQALLASWASFPLKYLGLTLSVWRLRKVDFQYLKDTAAAKLTIWDRQNITAIGRCALVKSVLSSQLVFSITPLIVPTPTLHNINKLERAFLWEGTGKTTGAKCKGELGCGVPAKGSWWPWHT